MPSRRADPLSPLFTSALLGAALRGTVTDPAHVSVSAGNVLVYTILHLGVFLAFGIVWERGA